MRYLRPLEEVRRDGFLPDKLDVPGRRYSAAAEVLRRIPEPDYSALKRQVYDFERFVPGAEVNGQICAFLPSAEDSKAFDWPTRYAGVVYVSPTLESHPHEIVIAVVAHELAHLVLGHRLITHSERQRRPQEEGAWACVRRWGFESEVAAHKELWESRS